MGHAPPPDAPPPATQELLASAATFSVGVKLPDLPLFPGGQLGVGVSTPNFPFSICGFKLPGPFSINLGPLTLPPIKIPLPDFFAALGISCDGILNGHPLDFTAGVKWGGGRVATYDKDPDDP